MDKNMNKKDPKKIRPMVNSLCASDLNSLDVFMTDLDLIDMTNKAEGKGAFKDIKQAISDRRKESSGKLKKIYAILYKHPDIRGALLRHFNDKRKHLAQQKALQELQDTINAQKKKHSIIRGTA